MNFIPVESERIKFVSAAFALWRRITNAIAEIIFLVLLLIFIPYYEHFFAGRKTFRR